MLDAEGEVLQAPRNSEVDSSLQLETKVADHDSKIIENIIF